MINWHIIASSVHCQLIEQKATDFCHFGFLEEHPVALIQHVDSIEQCNDI